MTIRRVLCLGVVGLPLWAAAQSATYNSCDIVPENAKGKGTTICTHVASQSECEKQAARKGSEAWLKAHPPKFTPGVRCDAKNTAAKGKASAKGTSGVAVKATTAGQQP